MTKKKIAIIGLGNISKKAYLPILTADPTLDLVFYNRSPGPLAEMQATYRIAQGSTNLDEVLDHQPDAAFVLTASESHFAITKQCLENGIDVFVEKPATLHASDTTTLAEIADREGRILMVGFNRRFAPLHIQGKELWGQAPIGMGIFRKFRSSTTLEDIGYQLMDDIIHQIDLLRFYCGEGQVVSVTHQSLPEGLQGAVAVIRLETGGLGIIETNYQASGWQETYAVYGNHQTMEIDAFSNLSFMRGRENRQWEETYASSWQTTLTGRGFVGQIAHFFSCMATREMPLTSAWDSVKTQLLVEALTEAAKAG